VAGKRTKNRVERLLLRNVRQLQRDRAARYAIAVDDLRLTDASPFRENLAQCCVLRHERYAAIAHRQIDLRECRGRESERNRGECQSFLQLHMDLPSVTGLSSAGVAALSVYEL